MSFHKLGTSVVFNLEDVRSAYVSSEPKKKKKDPNLYYIKVDFKNGWDIVQGGLSHDTAFESFDDLVEALQDQP